MAGLQRTSGGPLTIRLLGRTEIRRLARDIDFRPRKALGQNFVHDANTVRRVVSSSAVDRGDHILEVGPGLGSLTLALLDRGANVTAVEIDPVLAERLPRTVAEHSNSESNRLTVLNRDVLSIGPAVNALAGASRFYAIDDLRVKRKRTRLVRGRFEATVASTITRAEWDPRDRHSLRQAATNTRCYAAKNLESASGG